MKAGPFLERRRVAITWVLAVAFLLFAAPRPGTIAAGVLLMCAGAAFRVWASGHIRKQQNLAREGPYSLTRNPLYFGSFVMACGALLMGWNGWVVIGFLLLAVPMYRTVMKREEDFLHERFKEEYASYRRDVPLFFPRAALPSGSGGTFDWDLVRRHREWRVWAGIALVTLLMGGKYYWM